MDYPKSSNDYSRPENAEYLRWLAGEEGDGSTQTDLLVVIAGHLDRIATALEADKP